MTADKPKRANQPAKAWKEGFNAGRRLVAPKRETRNPYPPGSDKALAWISGFIEALQKPLRAVRKP
jgi:hypothetical protein